MTISKASSFSALLSLCALCLCLTGCTIASTAPASSPGPLASSSLSGKAFGGQQAINGAKVYLLAANPAGYGSPSLSMLNYTLPINGVGIDSVGAYTTTYGSGVFNISNSDFSCTTGYRLGTSSNGSTLPGDEQIYLFVLGGDTGSGPNSNAGLLAALGPCNAQYSNYVTVNELTTIAAAYAFAGYATNATHLSSSGSALAKVGLANAGLNSGNLVSLATGLTVANSTGITRPVATLNTLANILASCLDGTSGNSNCNTLFQYTESGGATGTAATDTATAAINLAHNPYPTAAGMTALYGLVPSTGAPFGGGLTAQPNDFTLALILTGNGLNGDAYIAIDAAGNAWVTNSYSLSEFTSTGSAATGSPFTGGGLSQYTEGLAIDSSGNLWIPNALDNNVSVFSSAGIPRPNTPYTGGGLRQPQCVAIDASGNAWFANTLGTSISAFSSSGIPLSANGFAGSNYAECLGISAANQIWVTNAYSTLSVFNNAGSTVAGSPFSGGGLNGPFGIAFDPSGRAWSGNIYGNNVSVFTNAGAPLGGSPFGGAGISYPEFLAIDSAGNVWVGDNTANRISELSSSGAAITPASGYTGGITGNTIYPAIDGSGNVWVTQSNATVAEIIGAASPVVTPIVANMLTPYNAAASKP